MDRATAYAKLEELRPTGVEGGIRTQGTRRIEGALVDPRPTFGLGLTTGTGPEDFQIAVLVQDEAFLGSARVEAVVEAAGGEADVQFVGIPEAYSAAHSGPRDRARPLVPGCSISSVTTRSAGTLGCFVEDDDGTYILSNSHVIADFGTASAQLETVQPGRLDGGAAPSDVVAALTRAVPVDPSAANLADAAIAELNSAEFDVEIPGIGTVSRRAGVPDIGDKVVKRGRTTGLTAGTIRTVNVNIKIRWPDTLVEFTDLVLITTEDPADHFGKPGDSGSLIVGSDDNAPLALLMAGGRSGGETRVYGVPMGTVLSELAVRMA